MAATIARNPANQPRVLPLCRCKPAGDRARNMARIVAAGSRPCWRCATIAPMQPTTDPAILAEQVAYYRKRAGEYDEWWFRTGRYDHGAELNAAWHADCAEV